MYHEYFILGFKINSYNIPEDLYLYKIPESEVPILRAKLLNNRIPHAIQRSMKENAINVYTTSRVKYNILPQVIFSNQIEPEVKLRILRSAIRIHFLSQGWRRSVSKLYDPNSIEEEFTTSLINVYKALKIQVATINKTLALLIDPCKKLEFRYNLKTLEEKYGKKTQRISWVKLINATWSFYVVKPNNYNIFKNSEDLINRVREYVKILEQITPSFKISKEQLFVNDYNDLLVLEPRSIKLRKILKEKTITLKSNNAVRIILPKNILTPVASFENLINFGELPLLKMTPQERFNEINKIRKDFLNDEINIGGIKISLSKKLLKVIPLEVSKFWIRYDNKIDKINEFYKLATQWGKYIKEIFETYRLNILIMGYKSKKCKLNSECRKRFDTVINKVSSYFENSRKINKENVNVNTVEVDDYENDVQEALKLYYENDAINISIMVGAPESNIEEEVQTTFEYISATEKYYPYYISFNRILADIERNIQKQKNKGKSKVSVTSLLKQFTEYRLNTIMRALIVRAMKSPLKIDRPDFLKDMIIAGIDATRIFVRNYTLSLGIIVVMIDEKGEIKYELMNYSLDVGDTGALAAGLEELIKKFKDRVLVYANKSSTIPLLSKLSYKPENSIIIGASKSHSYSRLIQKDGKIYVNPMPGKYVWLYRYKDTYNNFVESKALLITTMSSIKYGMKGTIVPVLFSITSNQKILKEWNIHDNLISFSFSLCGYNNISSNWMQSLPWPLHRADRLAKKVYRITKVLKSKQLPDRIILKYL